MQRFIFALIGSAALILPVAAVSAAPTVSVGTIAARPGTTVSVPIGLSADAQNVAGVELTVTSGVPAEGKDSLFSAALEAQSVFSQVANGLFDWAAKEGVVRAAMVRAEPTDGPLPVLTLKVAVPADAAPGTTYPLTLTAKLNDPDGRTIGVTVQNGSIVVQ